MRVLVVGAHGSMGVRYQAICKYLNRDFFRMEKTWSDISVDEIPEKVSGIIIATPTDTHLSLIRKFLPYKKPILCEKPITTDVGALHSIMEELKASTTPFRMMFQYDLLTEANKIGPTRYNYFKHGSDGLVWDCLQIIALGRSDIKLGEDSPVWSCMINGKALSLSHMDAAYIAYVQRWFRNPSDSLAKLVHAHEKTAEYKNGFY
jgi:hypothetical protein